MQRRWLQHLLSQGQVRGPGTNLSGIDGAVTCAGNHVPPLTSWVISGKSLASLSLPFPLCNGWMKLLPLQCGSSETELVTVPYEPQMCHVCGGIVLFLAITCSLGSPENLGLLGFGGGTAGEDRLLSCQRGRDLLKTTGVTCLLQPGCWREWRVRPSALLLSSQPQVFEVKTSTS